MSGLQDAIAKPVRCVSKLSQPRRRLEDKCSRRAEPFDYHGMCRESVELLGISDDHGDVRNLMYSLPIKTVPDQRLCILGHSWRVRTED